mgnify:CR=1 FL=1
MTATPAGHLAGRLAGRLALITGASRGLGAAAALAFADGSVVTGANVENASYGLTLCAETVAAARAIWPRRAGPRASPPRPRA